MATTKTLDQRYEEAGEKVRQDPTAANRKIFHALRDQLVERAQSERANRTAGFVTAENAEES